MRDRPADGTELEAAARGGRVAHSGFLDEAASAALLARLRGAGVAASAWGGIPAAARRVVTARPDHVPEAAPTLAAVYLPGVEDGDEARVALRAAGAEEALLGDTVRHADGLSVVTLGDPPEAWLEPLRIGGRRVEPQAVGIDRVAAGTRKTLRLVVPSLRVDVLGAKAFGASRSWFTKGVANGRVRVDGEPAGKSTSVDPGSEVWAEGLGRMRLLDVEGETKRGNRKVVVEVEKP